MENSGPATGGEEWYGIYYTICRRAGGGAAWAVGPSRRWVFGHLRAPSF